ncbi:GILT-like protein 3 [Ceratitis capitata]|uniref:GILT-like protein 3 n=1 Tax=Ceratitis capitata TaxID=7213 RepID=UPI000329FF61|nr:GILT-like protein 3 [Ceratitis capitata]
MSLKAAKRKMSTKNYMAVLSMFYILSVTLHATKTTAFHVESSQEASSAEQLRLGVYYETLCPDSRSFMRNSLYDGMILNEWLKYTELELIPYGKVTSWTDPDTNITTLFCQHGRTECELNALHACIVEHHDVRDQLKLISCLLSGHTTTLDECAKDLVLDVSAVKECKAARSIPDILKKYGEKTDALDISFVPSVTFDGKFDRWRQRYFIYNFSVVFCREYKAKFNVTLPQC